MTKSTEDIRTTTTTTPTATSRFGGSVYRSKTRSFPKEAPETSSVTTKVSEFTLDDAISPVSVMKTSSRSTNRTHQNGNNNDGNNDGIAGRDLLAEISFDDSRGNNISIYESATTSANSSFDVMHSSPTRYPSSKHVSFDGSNISNPVTPDHQHQKRTSTTRTELETTPDRIISLEPIYANDQKAASSSSNRRLMSSNSISSTAISIDDESDVTVPTSNIVDHHVATTTTAITSKLSTTRSMDDASVSSHISYDEFGVARNAYETSTREVSSSKDPIEMDVITKTLVTATTTTTNDEIVKDPSSSQPTNGTDDDASPTEPKKASWMKYLRPLNNNITEEKVEDVPQDETPIVGSVWQPPLPPFALVNMYQDPKEITPVLFMVESKRQCWFIHEMECIRREWLYYKKLIRDNVQEVIRVEDMLRSSNEGFTQYVQNIEDMMADMYVNEQGDVLSKKEKMKLLKRRSDAGVTTAMNSSSDFLKNHTEDVINNDSNVWLTPMITAFSEVQGEIKTYLPYFEDCLLDVIALKQEMRARGKELDEKGNLLNLHVMEQAESNIQEAFEALMNVIDELERVQQEERKQAKAVAAAKNTTGSDGVLRSFVDETKTDEAPFVINDRWLYESQYRYAAKLGLLSWKENRKDYEFWYAEIIALHEERKCRLNEVLVSFLPQRKELVSKIHVALMSGSEALDDTKITAGQESGTIDKVIERNAIAIMKNDTTKQYADLTMDVVFHNPKVKNSTTGAVSTKYARSGTDLWKSALIRERRLVELKVNKEGEYKLAVCIVTLDDCMHIFVLADEILKEALAAESNNATTPTQPLDFYTKYMSNSGTTKVPPVEYSIKLLDYDISIVGDNKDEKNSKSNSVFGSFASDIVKIPTELEFIRKARSMIFRKRDDQITLRVPSKKDAVKFLRNRLPVGERLTEI